jgi:hypothetical protein
VPTFGSQPHASYALGHCNCCCCCCCCCSGSCGRRSAGFTAGGSPPSGPALCLGRLLYKDFKEGSGSLPVDGQEVRDIPSTGRKLGNWRAARKPGLPTLVTTSMWHACAARRSSSTTQDTMKAVQ